MGESQVENDKITCLVGRDRWTRVTFAHVVKGKVLTDEWIVSQTYEDIRSLGYPEVRLRADTEPAIKASANIARVNERQERRQARA